MTLTDNTDELRDRIENIANNQYDFRAEFEEEVDEIMALITAREQQARNEAELKLITLSADITFRQYEQLADRERELKEQLALSNTKQMNKENES